MKGVCPKCKQLRWLGGKDRCCKPCAYQNGICKNCSAFRKIHVDGLCYCCYQDRQVNKTLDVLESEFNPKTPYNREMFSLYLLYIRRYRLAYFHIKQARRLKEILEFDDWSTIKSWKDIYEIAERYDLNHKNGKENGSAVKKIGYMLEEIGVLTSNRRDLAFGINNLLLGFEAKVLDKVKNYADWMERSGRCESTICNNLRYLLKFHNWLARVYPQIDLFQVHYQKVIEYHEYVQKCTYRPSQIRYSTFALRRFYDWLIYDKTILCNPADFLSVPAVSKRLVVIDEHHLKQLFAYIKDPSSLPGESFYLALILFFGFTTDDLLNASLEVTADDRLQIILSQRRRSCGRHHYNRDQILTLPDKPQWFQKLQSRFLKYWQPIYDKTPKTFPAKRLVLPHNYHYSRPISYKTLIKRIHTATLAATGLRIPLKVLRQTCGVAHTKNGDASLLTRLGWSPATAFAYTWFPREIFFEPDSKQTTSEIH